MSIGGLEVPLTGGCQCGGLRYEVTQAPVELYVCHCRECRKQSASAFGISVIVPKAGFRLTKGAAKTWTRPTDSGRQLDCHFCPDCGSRVWHEGAGFTTLSVKGGTFDQAPDISGAHHIWTSRKMPGLTIPEGTPCFPEEP